MTVPVHDTSGLSRTQPVISVAGAKAVLRAAEAKATEIGVPVVIVVVDDGGDLKALLGMDGPPKGAIQWSIDKAVTAASFAPRPTCWPRPWRARPGRSRR